MNGAFIKLKNTFNEDRTGFMLLVFLTLVVFTIHIRYVGSIGIFTSFEDEFGYWGNAAYLAGLDWSNIISNIPYYSYGYSLLLVPWFWIFDNPVFMYKAALTLNAILLSACFLLCYDVGRKLMNTVNKYVFIAVAFLISVYPSYVVYSSKTLSECLLIFICWLLTWCFVNLNQKSSNYKFILIGFLSIYVYIVHQRALGILIASVTIILLMKVLKKINWQQFSYVLFPIILLSIMHFYLKNDIQSHLWVNNVGNLANDYTEQVNKINQLFTIDGLLRAAQLFMGQFFYLGAASYLLCYFGLYELIQKIGKTTTCIIKKKDFNITDNDRHFFVYCFLLIAFILLIAISVTYLINPFRTDHLIYGRYTEIVFGPIMLLGFVKLKDKELSTKLLLGILIGFTLLAKAVNLIIQEFSFGQPHYINIIGLSFMYPLGDVLLPTLIAVLAGSILFLSFRGNDKKKIIALTLVTVFFLFTGEPMKKNTAYSSTENLKIANIAGLISTARDNLPIYFLWDHQDNPAYNKWDQCNVQDRLIADCYQFLLKDQQITIINNEELRAIAGDKLVLSAQLYNLFDLMDDYQFCMSNPYSYLLVSKTSPLANDFYNNYPVEAINLPLGIFEATDAVTSEHYVKSEGTPGIFIEGPNKELNKGNYSFVLDMDLIDYSNKELGYIEAGSFAATEVLNKKSLNIDNFDKNNKLCLEIPFQLDKADNDIGLRIYVNEGTQLKINYVHIKKQ